MKPGRIHVGTSGWHYNHWIGPFYPKHTPISGFLSFYSQRFQTVEINNTFYHLPTHETLTEWRKATPNDFLFACKGSRFITHMKKLKDPEQSIQRFFDGIKILGSKLGPILFQLPPRWTINVERLEAFLKELPKKYQFAFEFRDGSWFEQATYDALAKYKAAFCLYHLAGRWTPEVLTAEFVYIRLHGSGGPYQGQYAETVLSDWARKCLKWCNEGKDVYCYFDNDQNGYAATDATRLKKIIENRRSKE